MKKGYVKTLAVTEYLFSFNDGFAGIYVYTKLVSDGTLNMCSLLYRSYTSRKLQTEESYGLVRCYFCSSLL